MNSKTCDSLNEEELKKVQFIKCNHPRLWRLVNKVQPPSKSSTEPIENPQTDSIEISETE
ncbi:hypothetical protein ACFL0D_07890 [Thermoproteota archaeon]